MFNEIINKYRDLLEGERDQSWRSDQTMLLVESLSDFVEPWSSKLEELEEGFLQSLTALLVNLYDTDVDPIRRSVYVRAMILFSKLTNNSAKDQLQSKEKEFMSNATYDSIKALNPNAYRELVEKYPNDFRNLAMRDLKIFDSGIQYLPENERPNMAMNLLDQQRNIQNPIEKEPYFQRVVLLAKSMDDELKVRMYNELMELKLHIPEVVRKFAKNSIFRSDQIKQLKKKN